jgi:hypothetical protein
MAKLDDESARSRVVGSVTQQIEGGPNSNA